MKTKLELEKSELERVVKLIKEGRLSQALVVVKAIDGRNAPEGDNFGFSSELQILTLRLEVDITKRMLAQTNR